MKYSFDARGNQMNLAEEGWDDWKSDSEGTAGNRSPIKPTKKKVIFHFGMEPRGIAGLWAVKVEGEKKKKKKKRSSASGRDQSKR